MSVENRQHAAARPATRGESTQRLEDELLALRAERARERAQTDVLRTVDAIGRTALTQPDDLARRVTSDVARAVGAQVGALFLGTAPEVRLAALATADSLAGLTAPDIRTEVLPTAPVVLSADISLDPVDEDIEWLRRFAPGWVPRSYLAHEVRSAPGGRILGRFVFASGERGQFSERDQDVVAGVSAQVSVALENALLLEETQRAIRHRDEFLSIASHELKTPLTVLKGYALLLARRLRSGAVSATDVAGVAEELAAASERLDQLVNDLLDTSRIRTRRLELRPTLIDVRRLVESVVARFQQPNAGTHEFILEVEAGLVGFWDEGRVDQVLTNLVSNAVRYSPDGGLVRVVVERMADDVHIAVTDEGIGIPLERQSQLFEPFQRLHADKRIVDGTGLGLYISQQIVGQHGGSLSVESAANAGATFTVRLPMALPGVVTGD
ncbi:MAG: HAMP domain-containing histidine kinase [Dehalococcoidia bacterium]|nr:HAMP domain-containing histidine kinase [Dehalococcoidia bacterium]